MVAKKGKHGGVRERAGRPATLRNAVLYQFRIERADVEALNRLAKRKGFAARELLRRALRAYLRRYGKE